MHTAASKASREIITLAASVIFGGVGFALVGALLIEVGLPESLSLSVALFALVGIIILSQLSVPRSLTSHRNLIRSNGSATTRETVEPEIQALNEKTSQLSSIVEEQRLREIALRAQLNSLSNQLANIRAEVDALNQRREQEYDRSGSEPDEYELDWVNTGPFKSPTFLDWIDNASLKAIHSWESLWLAPDMNYGTGLLDALTYTNALDFDSQADALAHYSEALALFSNALSGEWHSEVLINQRLSERLKRQAAEEHFDQNLSPIIVAFALQHGFHSWDQMDRMWEVKHTYSKDFLKVHSEMLSFFISRTRYRHPGWTLRLRHRSTTRSSAGDRQT